MIENKKYQFLREIDGKIVLAKKKGLGALTLQKTKTGLCFENFLFHIEYLSILSITFFMNQLIRFSSVYL